MVEVTTARRDASTCLVYHGAGTDPAAFGETGEGWRSAGELLTIRRARRAPAVLVVDSTMLARIDDLRALPPRIIILTTDEASESALGRRARGSVAGFREAADRKRVLGAMCKLARARELAMRRNRQLARTNRELSELNRVGASLMGERDLTALLRRILELGKALTESDGAGLLLADAAAQDQLTLAQWAIDSLPDIVFPSGPLQVDDTTIVGHAARIKEPMVVSDAYDTRPDAGYVMSAEFDAANNYRRRSMLIVPMLDHKDRLVGVLVLINRKSNPAAKIVDEESADRYVLPYTDRDVRLARSLAGQAAVSIENVQLYARIESTLESVVKSAVSAIDQRDPTTAGHSLRVAALTIGLAEAVERGGDGPYRDLRFTPQQIRELRFAALLHDFGKVVVREDVLVKAKKLTPVLCERVDNRFSLIRCTAELEGARRGIGHAEIRKQIEELERMHAIVRDANEPTVTDAQPAAGLRDIARRTFERPDGTMSPYLTDEELHFLELRYGTLDDEERTEVESHVEATYQYLASIPWTQDLSNLATYAYGHHERLNGTGYPLGLKGDEIPVQARLIAVADVFDALTESDRPYKPAVAPEKALDILRSEADAGRIDGDIVRIMAESQVYKRILGVDWRTL